MGMQGAQLGRHHPVTGERGQLVDGEVGRALGLVGLGEQLPSRHLAQEEGLVGMGQLWRMGVPELVEQRQQPNGPALESGLLDHFPHHGPRRRVADVAPAPRQGPAAIAALLHQQQPPLLIEDQRPHIQLGGGVTAVEGDPVGDGRRIQLALAGHQGDRGRSQCLETADIEGIFGVGEARLRRGQHLFQKGGQRRLHG
ncbi:hypothetical protein D3C72_1318270 [compost metagenome]